MESNATVYVRMPLSLKRALIARSEELDTSVNDVAVGILATRVGFDFQPSGRRRSKTRIAKAKKQIVVLRMPADGRQTIKVKVWDAG